MHHKPRNLQLLGIREGATVRFLPLPTLQNPKDQQWFQYHRPITSHTSVLACAVVISLTLKKNKAHANPIIAVSD